MIDKHQICGAHPYPLLRNGRSTMPCILPLGHAGEHQTEVPELRPHSARIAAKVGGGLLTLLLIMVLISVIGFNVFREGLIWGCW